MKAISTPLVMSVRWFACAIFLLFFCSYEGGVFAQVSYPVTSVTTGTTNSSTSTTFSNIPAATGTISSGLAYTYNFTYGKATVTTANHVQLDGFVANGLSFTYSGVQAAVSFRRVNINVTTPPVNLVTGNRVSLWFERLAANNTLLTSTGTGNGGTAQLVPDYTDVMETLFAGRTFNIGIDNVFQNANTTNNNNIERVDVVFHAGVQATNIDNVGFAVFDRGNDGGNDPFLIAAIKTIDAATGAPTSYYTPVSINNTPTNSYGSGLTPSTSVSYHILRKEAADAHLEIMTPNQAAQNRNGVFLSFRQLSVPAASTAYGYSLFAPDVTYTAVSDLVDYTNSAHFPNNTDLGGGGLDLVAVTGVAYTNSALIVLPVKVESFTAVPVTGSVRLDWQLGVTDGLKETIVERSQDGTVYSPIFTLSGSPSGPQTLSDDQPLQGQSYYRLKFVNMDGNVAAYSQVCSVLFHASGESYLTIYPNPVINKQFSVGAGGLKNMPYQLRVSDMNGKLILTQKLAGSSYLKTNVHLPNGIPAGLYTLQLMDGNGNNVLSRSLILE